MSQISQVVTDRPTHVVAFGNQKGGVGKTTTAFNLAAALAQKGKKILLWDLDVNCGATRLAGITSDIPVGGTFEVMTGEEVPEDVIIQASDDEQLNLPVGVDLIPAHAKLEHIEAALANISNPFSDTTKSVLTQPLQRLKGMYDYIFLDTSPSMTPPTKAAHLSAQFFVITAIPEKLSIEGLVQAIKYLGFAREGGNPDLRLMGVVMSMVPGRATRVSRQLMDQASAALNSGDIYGRLFTTHITASTVVHYAQQHNELLFDSAPDHKVTNQYRSLATEFEERFRIWETENGPRGGAVATATGPEGVTSHG